jgi:hypothetical protein
VYYDPEEKVGYGQASAAPAVKLSDDVQLYLPEEARRRGIQIAGEEESADQPLCPRCGKSPCICGEDFLPELKRLRGDGAPSQAFQAIADQARDRKISAIRRLLIRAEGPDRSALADMKLLALAVPQLGKAAYRVELNLGMEFKDEEQFSIMFVGTWDRYKRLRQVTEAFGDEAKKVTVRITLHIDFPDALLLNGNQFQTIRDVFDHLSFGRLLVEAEPAAEAEAVS